MTLSYPVSPTIPQRFPREPRAPAPARPGTRQLEDAPEASAHAADVVRVAGGVGLHPFPAAPREADLKHSLSAKSERTAHAEAGLQPFKAQIARLSAHLPELGEHANPEGVHDLALIADLVCHEVLVTEAVVPVASQQVLVVDVGAAQGRLEIEGNPIPRERVAHHESAGKMDRSEALLSIQTDADVPSCIESCERKFAPAQRLVELIGDRRPRREPVQRLVWRIPPCGRQAWPDICSLSM